VVLLVGRVLSETNKRDGDVRVHVSKADKFNGDWETCNLVENREKAKLAAGVALAARIAICDACLCVAGCKPPAHFLDS
jgi:hypothetical protein